MESSSLLIFLLFLTVLLAGPSSCSPWVWQCDQELQTCSRVLPTQTTAPLDFLECKMTCSPQGTLWPLPSGNFSLSAELARFYDESSVQLGQMDMAQEVRLGVA